MFISLFKVIPGSCVMKQNHCVNYEINCTKLVQYQKKEFLSKYSPLPLVPKVWAEKVEITLTMSTLLNHSPLSIFLVEEDQITNPIWFFQLGSHQHLGRLNNKTERL